MKPDLFEAALLKTRKTWQTYITALCGLAIGFMIDLLGGLAFFSGEAEISVGGFKVVREALSATYGILFAVFIATASFESRLLKTLSQTAAHPPESTEFQLWVVSPFSKSRWGRVCWRVFFGYGYFLLAVFSLIHLTGCIPPTKMAMSLYFSIGVMDALIFGVCFRYGLEIYRNLRFVRHRLETLEREGA